MKYLIAILVMLPMAAAAHSPASCPKLDPVLQFVGKTTAITSGHELFLGGKRLCQAEFPDSNICTTRDLAEGDLPPLVDSESVWIKPFWIDSEHEYTDRIKNDNSVTCHTVIKLDGFGVPLLSEVACNDSRSVACCALTP